MRSIALVSCAVLVGSVLSVGCGPRASTTPATPRAMAPSAPVAQQPPMPEIVRLVGRHFTATIVAGPKAPLYTVVSSSGDVLAERLTLAELRTSRPEVYRDLAPAMAPSLRADARDPRDAVLLMDARKD